MAVWRCTSVPEWQTAGGKVAGGAGVATCGRRGGERAQRGATACPSVAVSLFLGLHFFVGCVGILFLWLMGHTCKSVSIYT